MAIQNRRQCLRQGIVGKVLPFDKNGIDPRDRPGSFRTSCPFDKAGKLGKDRGRKAAGRRGLSRSKTDLPKRSGIAGQRIHHEQNVLTAIPEHFGDGHGKMGRPGLEKRGKLPGRDNQNGSGETLRPQIPLEKFPDLPPPLPDQGDDIHIHRGVPGHHSHQGTLSHPRTGENPDLLPLPHGGQSVDRPDRQVQGPLDAPPEKGVERTTPERDLHRSRRQGSPIHGATQGIENTSQPVG